MFRAFVSSVRVCACACRLGARVVCAHTQTEHALCVFDLCECACVRITTQMRTVMRESAGHVRSVHRDCYCIQGIHTITMVADAGAGVGTGTDAGAGRGADRFDAAPGNGWEPSMPVRAHGESWLSVCVYACAYARVRVLM